MWCSCHGRKILLTAILTKRMAKLRSIVMSRVCVSDFKVIKIAMFSFKLLRCIYAYELTLQHQNSISITYIYQMGWAKTTKSKRLQGIMSCSCCWSLCFLLLLVKSNAYPKLKNAIHESIYIQLSSSNTLGTKWRVKRT